MTAAIPRRSPDRPRQAFEALANLNLLDSREEVLADAVRDPSGRITGGRIDWHELGNAMQASWTNTVLGTLTIEGTSLVADVNSAERAKRLREEIEKRLGRRATFERTVITSVEKELEERARFRQEPDEEEEDAFSRSPEAREAVRRELEAHYTAWVDEKLPALGGRTPRQTVRTADGRARVEALLRGAEIRPMAPDPSFRLDLGFVRRILGIDAPDPTAQGSRLDEE